MRFIQTELSFKILLSALCNSIHLTPYPISDQSKSLNLLCDMALCSKSHTTFQAQTLTNIHVGMRQLVPFYSTRSGNSEFSCCWDRSISRLPFSLL